MTTKNNELKTIIFKIQKYCVYQERCQHEVLQKLLSWGVDKSTALKIINQLIKDNFINENRFVTSFVRGKFHHNKWGKIKIIHELRIRKIDECLIQQGINEISPTEYISEIKKLIHSKSKDIKEKNDLLKHQKIARYLISRGFEPEIVFEQLNNK